MAERAWSLADVSDGDLVFFVGAQGPQADEADAEDAFGSAVRAVAVADRPGAFHVGILANGARTLVHAWPKHGVLAEPVVHAVRRVNASRIQVHSVDVDAVQRVVASEWALERVGARYNDVFSLECVDSTGAEAYYCCQLVVRAYAHCGLYTLCPAHRLNFRDSSGDCAPFWREYFRARKVPVPQNEPGSHPSRLLVSPHLRLRLEQYFSPPMDRIVISRTVDSALHFVCGVRTVLKSPKTFRVIQPRNGELLTDCSVAGPEAIDAAVDGCRRAQRSWAATDAQRRGAVLRKAAVLIRESLESLAYLETLDSGKPICESRADMQCSADCFDFFAGVVHDLAGRHFPLGEGRYAYTVREPWGVVGAIGVWNYPMQTAAWKLAPALACGNAVLYKPSPLAPVTPVFLAQLLHLAGVPEGLVAVLQGDAETGRLICEHAGVDKVTFTGSTATGAKVLGYCARETRLKHACVELGGKSALIVFADANLQMAVTGALMANFFAQGEVCSNASKVLVQRGVFDEFKEKITLATRAIRVGDPLEEDTRCGALISAEHLRRVIEFVEEARQQGAKVLCGGERLRVKNLEDGFYMSPAVLENISEEMRIYKEEIFGPVMLLIPFDSDEDAIRMANDTDFGLAAGIFTDDLHKAYSMASRLQAGNVYVNTFNDTNSQVPFGGTKQSGFGRENGTAALEEFSQLKSVFVNASKTLESPF